MPVAVLPKRSKSHSGSWPLAVLQCTQSFEGRLSPAARPRDVRTRKRREHGGSYGGSDSWRPMFGMDGDRKAPLELTHRSAESDDTRADDRDRGSLVLAHSERVRTARMRVRTRMRFRLVAYPPDRETRGLSCLPVARGDCTSRNDHGPSVRPGRGRWNLGCAFSAESELSGDDARRGGRPGRATRRHQGWGSGCRS